MYTIVNNKYKYNTEIQQVTNPLIFQYYDIIL